MKTVKLGMGISIDEVEAPSGVLKPNWIVTGANEKFSATILVDGLDSSHYIVRVEKLEGRSDTQKNMRQPQFLASLMQNG